MVGEAVPRALGLLLVAATVASCGGDTTRDDAAPSSSGVEDGRGGSDGRGSSTGGAVSDSGTTIQYAALEPHNWRASLDYGEEGTPAITNWAVHGISPTDVFVAGTYSWGMEAAWAGFVDHFASNHWEPIWEGDIFLSGVWAASSSLAFAVGSNRIFRIDGPDTTVLNIDACEVLCDVWGWADNDVLAVGWPGCILHYDGEEWVIEESGTGTDLEAVWGSDPDNVFAVGRSGVILTRSGGTWSSMESGISVDLNDVWGSGPSDVYAVGGFELDPGHVILHYDGSGWSLVHTGETRPGTLYGVSGRSASDIAAVGYASLHHALFYHFDGNTWQEVVLESDATLWDVWPADANKYIVAGTDDTLATVRY